MRTGRAVQSGGGARARIRTRAWAVLLSALLLLLGVGARAEPPAVFLQPSRSSGVAPLGVFLDARGTSDAKDNPRTQLTYRWSFSDGTAPVEARGLYEFAHVFAPTSFPDFCGAQRCAHVQVTLEVRSRAGETGRATRTLEVLAPDSVYTRTVCVSASGSFDGCPARGSHVTAQSFSRAVAANRAGGTRVLFHGGEHFSCDGEVGLNFPGPFAIGSFGKGRAIVEQTRRKGDCLKLSHSKVDQVSDYRIGDLEMHSQLFGAERAIDLAGRTENVLLHDLDIHDYPIGVFAFGSPLQFHRASNPSDLPHSGLVLSNVTITLSHAPRKRVNPLTLFCDHCAMLGGGVIQQKTHNTHLARSDGLFGAVIAFTTLKDPSRSRAAFKLHAGAWSRPVYRGGHDACPDCVHVAPDDYVDRYGPTDGVIFFRNHIVCNHTSWCMPAAPQNVSSPERLDRVSWIDNTLLEVGQVGIHAAVMRGVAIGNRFDGGKCIESMKRGKEWGSLPLQPIYMDGNEYTDGKPCS